MTRDPSAVRGDFRNILLLRPAALSDAEAQTEVGRLREEYPGASLVVWDERAHSRRAIGPLLALRRGRFDLAVLPQGAAGVGYGKCKIVAALVGAPALVDGAVCSSGQVWADILSTLTYRLRMAGEQMVLRLRAAGEERAARRRRLLAELRLPLRRGSWQRLELCPVCQATGFRRLTRGLRAGYVRCETCGATLADRWPLRRDADGEALPAFLAGAGPARGRCAGRPAVSARAERFAYLNLYAARFGRAPAAMLEIRGGGDAPAGAAEERGWRRFPATLAQLAAGALPELPAGGRFDLVMALDVLQRLPDPVACLRRLRRHCAPGAVVLVRVPDPDAAPRAARRPWPVEDLALPSLPALQRACQAAGFRVHHTDHLVEADSLEAWLVTADEDPS